MQDITAISAKKLASLIKNKKISCVEVMQAYLDRIAKVNPKTNALIELLAPEEALKQARAADEAIAKNQPLGKLHGVPISIKQARRVKGFMCNYAVQSPLNFIAKEDATVVARLRAAGAIIIGISNIPDFSMSYETDNALYGNTNNPYNLNHSPGGSSGGEASAIAACESALGIGADSGGSIRQPAHNCGIAGLKPTRGLIPSTGSFSGDGKGIFSYVETQGPMARYVEDLIYVLPILAGPDGQDPYTMPIPVGNAEQIKLKDLRVAYYTANGVATPNPEITDVVNKAALALKNEVATLTEKYPPINKDTHTIFEELFFYGGDKGQWLRDRMQKMQVTKVAGPFQAILDRASVCEFSVAELRQRLIALDQFKFTMEKFMQDFDVLICPVATGVAGRYQKTTPAEKTTAPTNIQSEFDLAYDLTYNLPFNITGWPATVVRCGTSKDGLPIGVQVIAKSWHDHILLAVAKRLEELFGGWQPSVL